MLSKRYHALLMAGRKARCVSYWSTGRKGTKANEADLEKAYVKLYKEPLATVTRVISIKAMT